MNPPNHYRILYVEDNEDSCQMVSLMCQFADIEVVTAQTIAEAWRAAQATHFDLYLLDIRFPGGDGLELCRRLRKHDARTPILIYSGCALETDKEKGLAAGASGYLTKPYLGDLAAAIRENIELQKKSSRVVIANC